MVAFLKQKRSLKAITTTTQDTIFILKITTVPLKTVYRVITGEGVPFVPMAITCRLMDARSVKCIVRYVIFIDARDARMDIIF